MIADAGRGSLNDQMTDIRFASMSISLLILVAQLRQWPCAFKLTLNGSTASRQPRSSIAYDQTAHLIWHFVKNLFYLLPFKSSTFNPVIPYSR